MLYNNMKKLKEYNITVLSVNYMFIIIIPGSYFFIIIDYLNLM